jgi:hypothetical protein
VHNLVSFEEVKALICEGGYRLATEWSIQGVMTREVVLEIRAARESADVGYFTMHPSM